MPFIHITMATGRTPEQKRALLAAVADAVHETTGTPRESVRAWITEVDPSAVIAGGVILSDRRK
ncbi:2-hydroxymuconate tautomerase [Actinosynnema sp. NPDC050436]|uniref:2-hydroxymuconate tautomerase n=1 Tax=Actinosynnema sp. NPDC050436 TaxID=3155659 RepID=UPI00340FA71F